MNRNEKRHPRENIRRTQSVQEVALENAYNFIAGTAKTVNKCYFDAMRKNKISEIRANKILEEVKELMKLESNK